MYSNTNLWGEEGAVMDDKPQGSTVSKKMLVRPVVVTASVLLVPLIATMFNWPVYDPGSPEPEMVNWTPFDFIVMGILVFITSFAYEYLTRNASSITRRMIVAAALFGALLVIWAELSVGVFDSPFAGS